MKNAISDLKVVRNEKLSAERQQRQKAKEFTESADRYKALADEYQRAIDLLEAAAATQPAPETQP